MADADILISLIKQTLGSEAADKLQARLAAAGNAPDEQAWQKAVADFRNCYRDLVKKQLNQFIPPPILALPEARALVNQLLDRVLDEGEQAIADAAREISLGPASATVNLPAVMLPAPNALNLKPALIGFQPPTGLALNFDGGPAAGGGALEVQRLPNQRLSGSLGLKMGIIQVSALSILEAAGDTYSLITLLSGRFAPGIQLGFGFALTGMGGLIGINRAVDAGAVEAQFRSGALANTLFGDNQLANPAGALNTLGAVFRHRPGNHVFGPAMQIAWLKVSTSALFNIDIGVFMQLPGPSRIDIIGSARAGIPLLFQLRMDVRGELDFARRIIGIHAVIVDSYVMGVFKMQGEAIFRLRYGDDPYVVLTIGGFFPGFNPAPAELPAHIQRVGLSLDLPVPLPLHLRVEGYLAVTANTLQFGAHLEAGFDAGVFSASGHFILDALFQFDPFRFEVRFSAGFQIKIFGESFNGVTCWGVITGPGPVVIQANIVYETPFFLPDIEWSDTFTIGRSAPIDTPTADLFMEMLKELTPGNLRAENGDDPHVLLRVKGGQLKNRALLAPLGHLVWSQRLAPLNLELERLNNTRLPGPNAVSVFSGKPDQSGPRERFNLGMYRNLSDAERMNLNARVEEHLCGVRKQFGLANGSESAFPLEFVEFRRPEMAPINNIFLKLLPAALLHKASTRADPAEVLNKTPLVALVRESWQAGAQAYDTQAAAHIAAQKQGTVAHLALDTVHMAGV